MENVGRINFGKRDNLQKQKTEKFKLSTTDNTLLSPRCKQDSGGSKRG